MLGELSTPFLPPDLVWWTPEFSVSRQHEEETSEKLQITAGQYLLPALFFNYIAEFRESSFAPIFFLRSLNIFRKNIKSAIFPFLTIFFAKIRKGQFTFYRLMLLINLELWLLFKHFRLCCRASCRLSSPPPWQGRRRSRRSLTVPPTPPTIAPPRKRPLLFAKTCI